MATIYSERTARKEHACAWDCGEPIMRGDRYVRSALTPHDNDIGNHGWWTHALHGRALTDCPRYRREESP